MTEYRITSNFEESEAGHVVIESLKGMKYDAVALKKISNPTTGEYFKAKGFKRADGKLSFESEILNRAKDRMNSTSEQCKFLIGISMYNEKWEEFRNTIKAVNTSLVSLYANSSLTSENVACIILVDGMSPFLETYSKNKEEFSKFFSEEMVKEKFDTDNLTECNFEYLWDKHRSDRTRGAKNEKIIEKIIEETSEDESKDEQKDELIEIITPKSSASSTPVHSLKKRSRRKEKIEFAHLFSQKIFFGNTRAPLNIILCVKQYNKRKLNSHLWLFGGFCEVINPEFVMLLDVGTKPMRDSLFHLYDALNRYPNIAGCCGEICPLAPSFWNLIVQAQVIEYKFSHMLDKALESTIGFITVLPGAFSAYRWEALQGDPLWKDYFKSIFAGTEEMDTFNSNIYLAEDRVLCLSLVSKPEHSYVLRYVRKSVAETDVPETLNALLAQRRRWINGSWFALIDTILKCKNLLGANHSCCRKLLFVLLIIYYCITALYTWLIVGIMYVALDIGITSYFENGSSGLKFLGELFLILYTSIIIVVVIMSLGAKPKMVKHFFLAVSYSLGVYQLISVSFIARMLINSDITNLFVAGIAVWFGLFALITLFNCQVLTVIRGAIHYIFMIPTYINILLIYAICNTHDCTWGNRPDALKKDELEKLESFERFRARWTSIWILCNGIFAFFILSALSGASINTKVNYFIGVGAGGIGVLVVRIFGGMLYLLIEFCKRPKMSSVNSRSGLSDKLI